MWSSPAPPLTAPPQWVGTPTSRLADVWSPCLPYAVPPVGETPQGASPNWGSGPTSQTQTGAPLAPPPNRTSPPLSCLLPTFSISSPAVPVFPTPYGGSVPPPVNRRQWTTTFFLSTITKKPPSVVSYTARRPASSALPYPLPSTSFASSPSRASTSLKLDVPGWGPPVEQTFHSGSTGGGVDFHPTGWLFWTEGFGSKILPEVFSVRALSLGIPPQGTSIGQG